ncbi:hypothetical protein COCOBI_04-0050 [Coccomyxa sp. Obi]|nr:hypothetical protein COCOBI_04-0050 [Coccomyxa sp. Obi]
MEGPGTSGTGEVEFIVKRPSLANVKDLKLKLSDDATLSDVKAKMTELYDDHPLPATITVIVAGKVLKDDSVQLKDVFKAVAKTDILPAMHVVVRPDGPTTPGDTQRQAMPEEPRQAPINATAQQWRPPPAAQQPPHPQPPPTPQPAPPSTALHGLGHQGAHGGAAAAATASASGVAHAASSGRPAGAAAAPSSVLLRAAAERQAAAAAARSAPSQGASYGAAASSSEGGTSSAVSSADHKGKAPASSAAAPAQPPPQPRSPGVSPTLPSEQRASSSGLPQPELPPQLVNNPAMAAAFSAAFAALTSPTAIHNLGVPQMGPVQPHFPVQGHATPQQALLEALLSGQPLQQQHPFPHLQPIFPQPISYMPVLGLVQPPPAENGQQQQPRYAPVLAPVVPMMMPYGMVPYSTGHVHFAGQQQPIPPGAQPQQQPRLVQNFLQGVPGVGVAWGQGGAAAAAAAARGGRPGRERRPRPVRVRMVQINLRAILQLAVMGIILYQHCPPGRFLLFATVGLALYVMGPAPLRRAWQRLLAMLPPMHEPGQQDPGLGGAAAPAAAPAAANGNAPAAAAGAAGAPPAVPAAAGVAAPQRPRGLVQELQALVVGFFTSLLPGFNINPEDAAAFAAAQQAANRAEALAAARVHND